MEKLKLKIKGLDSKSDSELIEKKLKKQSGVEMSKFNEESGKGVVVYEKGKIHEKDIYQLIRKMGDYEIISDKPEKEKFSSASSFAKATVDKKATADKEKSSGHDKDKDEDEKRNEEKYLGSYINNPMILGIFVGVSAMSIIINVIFLVMITSN